MKLNVDGSATGQDHAPELYAVDAIADRLQSLDEITDEHREFYNDAGFLAVENVFTPKEVQAARDAIDDLIMGKNCEFHGVQFEAYAREKLETMGIEERSDAVRKLMSFCKYDERLHAMAYKPSMMAFITSVVGDNTAMLQEMALLKPPQGREKPWHQDKAYFNVPVDTRVMGVWIALDEALPENGCMHLMPGSHRDGPVPHFQRRDWQICDSDILGKRCVVTPLKPGGVLFFDGLLHHGTPTNNSSLRRRALQFHYYDGAVERVEDNRLNVFGADGKGAEC